MVKFVDHMRELLSNIPTHSFHCAIWYLRSLEDEINKAVRLDYENTIDEDDINRIRKDIADMVYRLNAMKGRIQADKQIIDAALRDL